MCDKSCAVDRMFTSDQHTRCTKIGLLNFICSYYHISSTTKSFITQRSTFYVILTVLIFYSLANAISKLPEDGAEAPKHEGEFINNLIFNLLAPELFFFNFSTPCIQNVNNTGTKYVRIMKQTAF